jgi:hypothetical protein
MGKRGAPLTDLQLASEAARFSKHEIMLIVAAQLRCVPKTGRRELPSVFIARTFALGSGP